MPHNPLSLVAADTIRPGRFVKQDTTDNSKALECNANEMANGISALNNAEFDVTYHAIAGGDVQLQPEGIAYVYCAATITAGQFLKSDANGLAVPAATTGTTEQKIVAQAMQDAATDKKVKVNTLLKGWRHPATT